MSVLNSIEGFLGWALYNFKGHDNDLIFNHPEFANVPESIQIVSEDITDGEMMPFYTVSTMISGGNESPSFKLINVPKETASIVILLQDPDCPPFNATHFIAYNIQPSNTEYPRGYFNKENKNSESALTFGFGLRTQVGYFGPRPPVNHGPHRYFFIAISIDKEATDILNNYDKAVRIQELTKIIAGHSLAYGKLTPIYER